MRIKTIVFLLALILISCRDKSITKDSRVDTLPYFNGATFTPLWLTEDSPAIDTLHRISPFSLTNQEGRTVTEKTFENKIYVVDFFFTFCPGICPKMTENMALLQDEFLDKNDVLLLSHSVTPTRDSVPVLRSYAENKGVIASKWHLVTGTQHDIYKLGRKDYFVEEDLGREKDLEEFLHTENFVLVDKNRHIRGIYNGINKASVNQLIADIYTLRHEN